jgi:hypothetical protein
MGGTSTTVGFSIEVVDWVATASFMSKKPSGIWCSGIQACSLYGTQSQFQQWSVAGDMLQMCLQLLPRSSELAQASIGTINMMLTCSL